MPRGHGEDLPLREARGVQHGAGLQEAAQEGVRDGGQGEVRQVSHQGVRRGPQAGKAKSD